MLHPYVVDKEDIISLFLFLEWKHRELKLLA